MPKKFKNSAPATTPIDQTTSRSDPVVQLLTEVYMLRLKHPIDLWPSATYCAENKECPRVELIMFHGELTWRLGQRMVPYSNAVEFVLSGDWKRCQG